MCGAETVLADLYVKQKLFLNLYCSTWKPAE